MTLSNDAVEMAKVLCEVTAMPASRVPVMLMVTVDPAIRFQLAPSFEL